MARDSKSRPQGGKDSQDEIDALYQLPLGEFTAARNALAARLKANPVFLATAGPVGREIAHWSDLAGKLATPAECAVIAGNCKSISNPLLEGGSDLVVTVEETKLEGMKAFLCIDATHTFLMNNPEVMRQSLAFLRHGRFE